MKFSALLAMTVGLSCATMPTEKVAVKTATFRMTFEGERPAFDSLVLLPGTCASVSPFESIRPSKVCDRGECQFVGGSPVIGQPYCIILVRAGIIIGITEFSENARPAPDGAHWLTFQTLHPAKPKTMHMYGPNRCLCRTQAKMLNAAGAETGIIISPQGRPMCYGNYGDPKQWVDSKLVFQELFKGRYRLFTRDNSHDKPCQFSPAEFTAN